MIILLATSDTKARAKVHPEYWSAVCAGLVAKPQLKLFNVMADHGRSMKILETLSGRQWHGTRRNSTTKYQLPAWPSYPSHIKYMKFWFSSTSHFTWKKWLDISDISSSLSIQDIPEVSNSWVLQYVRDDTNSSCTSAGCSTELATYISGAGRLNHTLIQVLMCKNSTNLQISSDIFRSYVSYPSNCLEPWDFCSSLNSRLAACTRASRCLSRKGVQPASFIQKL